MAARPDAATRVATRIPVVVVLDDVRSAHNVGLVFRLCDCVNVEGIVLGGITAYPGVTERADNRLRKTAVGGSLDVVPWRHVEDVAAEVARLAADGYKVVVVEQGEGSVPWSEADLRLPLVLVFGHERQGVGDATLSQAEQVIDLPVRGVTNSLNVALCASAVLYEILRQQT